MFAATWIGTIITVAAFCHGVWNGIVYVFFGYGTKAGALGIAQYKIFDPERGLTGLVLNAVAVGLLWRWATRRRMHMTEAGYDKEE